MRLASVMACILVLALVGCGSSDREGSSKGEAAAGASTTPFGDWIRADRKQEGLRVDGTGEMNGVVAAGTGFVAVGEGDSRAAVWTSTDGMLWRAVQVDEHDPDPAEREVMMDVTVGAAGLVAVGFEQDSSGSRAAVWTSVDGLRWTRAPHQPAFEAARYQVMNGIASGGPGFVAVGWAEYDHATDRANAAVWISEDGRRWQRIPNDDDVFGVAGAEGMLDVTSVPTGVVAVGRDGPNATVWTSPDAVTWSRIAHDESLFGGGQTIWSVAVGGPGLIGVGYGNSISGGDEQEGAIVWTSVDGVHWTRIPLPEAPSTLFHAIAGDRRSLVAAGSVNTNDFEAAVWTSEDGRQWISARDNERVFGGPGNQVINGVAIGSSRAVAVGADHWNGPQPAVWSALRQDAR